MRPDDTAADYTATVNWGDGTTTAGTITANTSGGFDVAGAHTYAEEGYSFVTLTISDPDDQSSSAGGYSYVKDASLHASGATVTACRPAQLAAALRLPDGAVLCPWGVLALGWPAPEAETPPASGAPKPKLDEMYYAGRWGRSLPSGGP